MNDVEALQQILEDQNRSSFYWAIIILLAVNFLGVLANIFLSIYLKNKEAKHYRLQVREDRRLEIYEKLYYLLEELTYFDGRQNNNDLELKISNINSYTSQNNLYI